MKKKNKKNQNRQSNGPVCLLEISFFLESEFRESEFWKAFSDIW
jgi:hypothetical protein